MIRKQILIPFVFPNVIFKAVVSPFIESKFQFFAMVQIRTKIPIPILFSETEIQHVSVQSFLHIFFHAGGQIPPLLGT
jgi:hypothetical protein